MAGLKEYLNPKDFLEAQEAFLNENEMTNNVILGNCYNAILEKRSPEESYFLNAGTSEGHVNSVKLNSKIILSGTDKQALTQIFRFYKDNAVEYKGVIGNVEASELFSSLSKRTNIQRRVTLIQSLSQIKKENLPNGSFVTATENDLDYLSVWTNDFLQTENLFPLRTLAQKASFVKNLIQTGNFFIRKHQDTPVSMAAIIRKTKHTAIIGLVYTPNVFRGKGFGKSSVQQLSATILNEGFRESGLLVYQDNKIAQKIYNQLGYKTVSELLDIDFE